MRPASKKEPEKVLNFEKFPYPILAFFTPLFWDIEIKAAKP
jgi:hypothetical protein